MVVAEILNVIWVAMIILIIIARENQIDELVEAAIPLTVVSGIAYYCFVFNSALYVALTHIEKAEDIPLILENLFKQPPKYTFEVKNYHTRGKKDRTKITRVDSLPITFSYWRDISGNFDLELMAKENHEQKPYVYLALKVEIEGANDGTAQEISQNIEQFKSTHKSDDYQLYNEIKEIDGLTELHMIKVGKDGASLFSVGWFYFFSILPLFIFYSWFSQYFYVEREFYVKKLISKYSDLSQPQYSGRDPRIKINENAMQFCFYGKIEVPPQLPVANAVVIDNSNIPVGQVIYDPNNSQISTSRQFLNQPNNGQFQPNSLNDYRFPPQPVQTLPIYVSSGQKKTQGIPIKNK